MKKAAKIILLSLISLVILGFLLFYMFICAGIVPSVQETWVTTAMTTFSHKWLATSFIPKDRIDEIMEKNRVDDTGMDTIIPEKKPVTSTENVNDLPFTSNVTSDEIAEKYEEDKKSEYEKQGYKLLEECIYLKEVDRDGVRGQLMLVSDPMLVKLKDCARQFTRGDTVKRMVTDSGAVAGINGGGFEDGPNYDSNGGIPAGLLIVDGKVVNPKNDDGGAQYNLIGFRSDGAFILRHCTKQWALDNDIKYAVSFSPFLIVNGEGTIKSGTGGWGIAPRTALGQRKSGEVLFLVIDGRQPGWSIGCDIKLLQDILLEEGCENAGMMDGGSSTVMMYNGEYVNKPSLGHERYINNAWVVMSKTQE